MKKGNLKNEELQGFGSFLSLEKILVSLNFFLSIHKTSMNVGLVHHRIIAIKRRPVSTPLVVTLANVCLDLKEMEGTAQVNSIIQICVVLHVKFTIA